MHQQLHNIVKFTNCIDPPYFPNVQWHLQSMVKLPINSQEQDGDLQSQARIRLSKDELRTDILSGDVQMTDDR